MNWKFTSNTGPDQMLWHCIKAAGHTACYDGPFDLLVNWHDSNCPPQIRSAVNGMLKSIKKDTLDDVQRQAFGYSGFIDPAKHRGFAVEKWTRQGMHTGEYVRCPMKYDWHEYTDEHGCIQRKVYQVAIDSRIYPTDRSMETQGEQLIRAYAVSIMLGSVAAVWVIDKAIVNTFRHVVDGRIYPHLLPECHEEFSRVEIKLIALFAKKLGLDCGMVHILRDNHSGRLYVTGVESKPSVWYLDCLGDAARHDALQRHAVLIAENAPNFVLR